MTNSLPPSLTPEEWKSLSTCGEEPYDDTGKDDWCHRTGGKVFLSTVELTRPQAVAALCLYDQPYGFTREDVALCQGAIERAYQMIPKIAPVGLGPQDAELHETMTRLYSEEMHQWISLANRITALLPPE